MFSKNTAQNRVMNSKSDKIEIMIDDKADEVIKEHFESLLSGWQIGLKTTMKGNNFNLNCIDLSHYKCHKINLNHGR